MKLWQKIFLPCVALTMAGIFLVCMGFVTRAHSRQLQAERAALLVRSDQVVEGLKQSVENKTGGYFISSASLERLLPELCAALSEEGTAVSAARIDEAEAEAVPARMTLSQESGQLQLQRTVFLSGELCRVELARDIRPLLDSFRADVSAGQAYGVAASMAISVALLAVSLLITRPIKKLETATERIAEGDYGYRIEYRGQDELSELAGHMNEMAAHIEEDSAFIENISENRRMFIANMTHELKTPLTSILGFADVLRIRPDVSQEQVREYADIIFAEARRLKLLSARLMELLTVEETELQLLPTELAELIEREARGLQPLCTQAGLSLLPETEPVTVRADEALLATLILNLLDNARKASKPGGKIVIRCERRDRLAYIQVEDQGIGIPREQIARVTEAFYMVDKSRTRKAGGAGIGLALCKAIAAAHHGELHIESKLHEGTRVTVTLPVYEGGD